MEDGIKSENQLTSPAAFVEGGIQEACDDACSICLEAFCESDPSTVNMLEIMFLSSVELGFFPELTVCFSGRCQRSSQCPMCWQPISLKDPGSQELLDAIEQEKSFRINASRNATIFHHPALGDFEFQHLPVSATDAELEERIIQQLAAAAAMGRARHVARREGQRNRSSAQGRPHFLVFSTHPNASPPIQRGEGEPAAVVVSAGPPSQVTMGENSTQLVPPPPSQADQVSSSASGLGVTAVHHGISSNNHRSPTQSSPTAQDRAGPSEFQSFSESLKSRFNAISMKYKESITKSTRGWKERLFSRNANTTALGSEVKEDAPVEIATVSHMMERLETTDSVRTNTVSVSNGSQDNSVPDPGNQQIPDTCGNNSLTGGNTQASCATSSTSN